MLCVLPMVLLLWAYACISKAWDMPCMLRSIEEEEEEEEEEYVHFEKRMDYALTPVAAGRSVSRRAFRRGWEREATHDNNYDTIVNEIMFLFVVIIHSCRSRRQNKM